MRCLESALSSFLLCWSALEHYQPAGEEEDSERGGKVVEGEEEEGRLGGGEGGGGVKKGSEEEGERGGEPDPLLSTLLHRLLAVLKQLVASTMKRSDSPATVAGYKSMYTVALRATQSHSSTDCGQLNQTRDCLRTIASLQKSSL